MHRTATRLQCNWQKKQTGFAFIVGRSGRTPSSRSDWLMGFLLGGAYLPIRTMYIIKKGEGP